MGHLIFLLAGQLRSGLAQGRIIENRVIAEAVFTPGFPGQLAMDLAPGLDDLAIGGDHGDNADELCEATGADGVAVIGTKFVIYRFSEKLQQERNQTGRAKRKATKVNPVRKGAQARRQAAKKVREQRNEYFRQMAIDKAIEKSRERQLRGED